MPRPAARGPGADHRALLALRAPQVRAQEHERRRLPPAADPDLARGAEHAPVLPRDAAPGRRLGRACSLLGRGMRPRDAWPLFKQAVSAWSDDYAPSMGAALSYYTLFSIAPLLLIVISVAGWFFGDQAVRG